MKKLFRLNLETGDNLVFSLIIRKKKSKQKEKTFDFVLGKIKKHKKIFVIEKIGSISYSSKKININFFRFIFWLRYKPIISLKAHKFLLKFIFRKWKVA